MNKYKNIKFTNDEGFNLYPYNYKERDHFLERFDIPIIQLSVPMDEREANIANDDDW